MSLWTKDLFEVAAERLKAKLRERPQLVRTIKSAARTIDAIAQPIANIMAGLIGGVVFGLGWGLLFSILWLPLGAFVGILAFFFGWGATVSYFKATTTKDHNWWDEE